MKKVFMCLLPLAVFMLVIFTGCNSVVEQGDLGVSATKINEIRDKTVNATSYNINYNVKKSLRYYYTSGTLKDTIAKEEIFNVDAPKLKKTKDKDDADVYDYSGSYELKRNTTTNLEKHKFVQYSKGTKMYTSVDGGETTSETISSTSTGKTDKLDTYFYNESYIKRIYYYKYQDGSYTYMFEYSLDNEETKVAVNLFDTVYYKVDDGIYVGRISKNSDTVFTNADDNSLKLQVDVDKYGYIVRQKAYIHLYIDGFTIGGNTTKGEAEMTLSIQYKW